MPSIRHYIGIQHLLSAALFCRQAYALEVPTPKNPPGELFTQHRAYVIGAVLTSVAFLEATINQLFQDAHDGDHGNLAGLDDRSVKAMAAMWGHGVPRTAKYPILRKYEIALSLAGRVEFPAGKTKDAADALIKLRNALTHYEPEWVPSDAPRRPGEKRHKLEDRLRSRFQENALTGPTNPFYPDKLLGHGCAEWSVTASLAYADAAHAALGVKPIYEGVRKDIPTR